MDLTQAILLSVIVVLAIFLVVIGFQAFFVLKDLRKSLTKMNKLMEDADGLVSDVKKPVNTVTSLFTALTAGAGIAHIIKKVKQLEGKSERK
ncbi:hypothetical protein A3J17_04295 [Candidatus Curtissbacteria bacterium RIFCSPLOWO2_02_FULL_40_11]|uniref:DUF948 domain-containing protein n=1 Tax=Candidatus Curtissbacteria bacterium RIFCSPLOWO2_12_FULL_38_9 TaxID=1797735 RepID=A0A1F5I9A2_9BACT|nr:MAG: hypothetical protein A3J17_04295 [Candidatus Curtissbacteria bacterium RIFCSPLOWO2_02_FULL_40_11]OGE12911.1 MAG: hypothetical protein A3G14_00575 [Candidatus Curtissbacteria bacterium RIFCSPLOWO2_12_FULL_38_9]